jgi:uncharacterized RDD family membrane protein YckC
MIFVKHWRRLCASLIDGLILFIPLFIYGFAKQPDWLDLGWTLAFELYILISTWKFGQTLGKKFLKIQVLRLDGQKVDFLSSFKRRVVDLLFVALSLLAFGSSSDLPDNDWGSFLTTDWLFIGLSAVWYFADSITIVCNTQRRALHDYIAGTVVVMKSEIVNINFA